MNKSAFQRIYEFEDFRFDAQHLMLYRRGESIPLAPKAAETLLVFIERRGQILSKEELIEQIWPDVSIEESNLFLYLSVLRKTLGNQKDGIPYLETLRRRGYRFNGSVQLTSDNNNPEQHSTQTQVIIQIDSIRSPLAAPPVNSSPINTSDERLDLAVDSRKSRRDRTLRRSSFAAVGIIALVAALALGYAYFFNSRPIDSIAVMPFVNESDDPQLEYIANGMTDKLIASLSKIPGLDVKPSSSVFRYKGKNIDATTIGAELNAQAVLFVKFVQQDEVFRLDVELVGARTQKSLWKQSYNREFSNLNALERDFTGDLVRELRVKRSASAEQKSYTENAKAYNLYLRGLTESRRLTTPEIYKGIEYFQQVIDNDPSYALAYAGIARAHVYLSRAGEEHPKELVKAKSAALKAVQLDDNLAEGHSALAEAIFLYDWNCAAAESEFLRALELNPNSSDTHRQYAHLLGTMGRREDAKAHGERALELEPMSAYMNAAAAMGRPEGYVGLERVRFAIFLDPKLAFARWQAAQIYTSRKMYPEAIEEARLAKTLAPGQTFSDISLVKCLVATGKRDEARAILDEMLRLSKSRFVPPWNIAHVYYDLGDNEQALAWLEKGYEVRDWRLLWLARNPSRFKDLQDDPRFQDLVRRIGLK